MRGGGVGEKPQDGKRGDRLARAQLADQRRGLRLADVEGDVPHGMSEAAAAAKIDGQVLDVDEVFPVEAGLALCFVSAMKCP